MKCLRSPPPSPRIGSRQQSKQRERPRVECGTARIARRASGARTAHGRRLDEGGRVRRKGLVFSRLDARVSRDAHHSNIHLNTRRTARGRGEPHIADVRAGQAQAPGRQRGHSLSIIDTPRSTLAPSTEARARWPTDSHQAPYSAAPRGLAPSAPRSASRERSMGSTRTAGSTCVSRHSRGVGSGTGLQALD